METPPKSSFLEGPYKECPDLYECVHTLFEQHLDEEVFPKKKNALCYNGKWLTFFELNHEAEKLAYSIWQFKCCLSDYNNSVECGDNAHSSIGVHMDPSEKLIITLFAVLKVGAAYLTLDPSYPEKQLNYIINKSSPIFIITDVETYNQDASLLKNVSAPCVSYHDLQTNAQEFSEKVYDSSSPYKMSFASLSTQAGFNFQKLAACILYTSGSTGFPKGVSLSHRAALNRLRWQWKDYPFVEGEVGLFKTSMNFVDHFAEVFGTLLQGIPLVVVSKSVARDPTQLVETISKYGITRLTVVPTLLKSILLHLKDNPNLVTKLSTLRLCICSGEELKLETCSLFYNVLPHVTLTNFYGSTEVMGDVLHFKLSKEKLASLPGTVPLGSPITNCNVAIVNENREMVPFETVGEICVSGTNLADGYYKDAEETKLSYTQITCSGHSNEIWYRTGDQGCMKKLGNNGETVVLFRGRNDSQVKIRGHRIDLTEVELALESITETCIVTTLLISNNKEVIVFFTSDTCTEEDVSNLCRLSFPSSIQVRCVKILSVPLLPNGKCDKVSLCNKYRLKLKALRDENLKILSCSSENREKILALLANSLGMPVASINTQRSYFDLGGHSLGAATLISELRERNIIDIPLNILLSSKTVDNFLSFCIEMRPVCTSIEPNLKKYKIISPIPLDRKAEFLDSMNTYFHVDAYWSATQMPFEAYNTAVEIIWAMCQKTPDLNFMVVDSVSNAVAGVCVGCDLHSEDNESTFSGIHDAITYFMDRMGEEEDWAKMQLKCSRPREWFHTFSLSTRSTFTHQENVVLVQLMEKAVLDLAKRKQFKGILTNNINRLTKEVCLSLGYEILKEYCWDDAEYKGSYPFRELGICHSVMYYTL